MRVAVVGAGIVGLFAASELHRAGAEVTAFDPEAPGARSVHAAGIIEPSRAYRTNTVAFLRRVVRYWAQGTCRLRSVDPRWLAYAATSLGTGSAPGAQDALDRLATVSVEAYRALAAAGNDFGYSERGLREKYRDPRHFDVERRNAEARSPRVPVEVEEGSDGGGNLFFPTLGWLHTERCTERLVRDTGGISWIRARVGRVFWNGSVEVGGRTERFDRVVVCTGVDARRLGLPLTAVRGFGWHLRSTTHVPCATILVDEGVAFSPFEGDLKATGGWDFDLSGSTAHADRILKLIRAQLAVEEVVEFNHGWRPCAPDGLPLVSREDAVVVANGGFRLGWSFAPGLGQCAADLALGTSGNDRFLARYHSALTAIS